MHNFFEAYKHGWNKLDNKAKEELIWFTCKILPAVQKAWKPFASRTANHRKYLKLLVIWMKPLGCFSLKTTSHCLPGQKSSYTDAGADDAIEPELAGDKQDSIEDDDKDDAGEMETASETDAVNAARSSKKLERKSYLKQN